jgi:hypothetical protein
VLIGCLVLAAGTLAFPSTPTYDPWAWILWGREIVHHDLVTTGGPSWKPLPMFFTIPFSLIGHDASPYLWLVVARAGGFLACAMAFRMTRRLVGGVAGILGGIAAAAALFSSFKFVRDAALGNSEALLAGLVMWAFERHLDGRRDHALYLGFAGALLRPEVWPFLGLYGLWLFWREARSRTVVVLGFAALPALWLLPELWGSGDLLRAAHRAHTPRANSAAFAEDPISEVVRQFGTMLTPALWIGLGALAAMTLLRLAPGRREQRTVIALALAAAVVVGEVALMTNDGFSGNTRYMILPAALVCVLAGTGIGWAVRALPGRLAASGLVVGAVAIAAAVGFAAPSVNRLDAVRASIEYQARLTDGLAATVARAGGADRLLACGTPYTGAFQVPLVAWQLGVPTTTVRSASAPGDAPPRPPGVAFRSRTTTSSRYAVPRIDTLGGEAGVQTFAFGGGWRIVGRCHP